MGMRTMDNSTFGQRYEKMRARNAKAVALFKDGYTIPEVKQITGYSDVYLRVLAKRANIKAEEAPEETKPSMHDKHCWPCGINQSCWSKCRHHLNCASGSDCGAARG